MANTLKMLACIVECSFYSLNMVLFFSFFLA